MTILEGFLWGIFGGFLSELLGFYKLSHAFPSESMAWARSFGYWLITILMVIAGGCLVIAYLRSNMALNAFLAMNVGASAPLIIGSLVTMTPKPQVRVD
jgi:hypothetical protein